MTKPFSAPLPFTIESPNSHVLWPQVPTAWAGAVLGVLYQLDRSQWWSAEKLGDHQWKQIAPLLRHAYETAPFYRSLYDAEGVCIADIQDWADWRRIPIVERDNLQAAGTDWHSLTPPSDHGHLLHHFTSGSTGRPLRALSTNLTHLFNCAHVLRHHAWHGRDTREKIAFIQETEADFPIEGRIADSWESATRNVIKTGPAITLGARSSIDELLSRLVEFQPAYLIAYPSIAAALAKRSLTSNVGLPSLRQIGVFGEILEPSCRNLARKAWDVPVVDLYSAMEVGLMALQCPEHEHLHILSEKILVEVLDDRGRECAPGEIGRVVVTALHNFAAPVIRYAIGDYAQQGAPCPCGRGLPVINRVLGRQRNMLCFPDGSRRWPVLRDGGLHQTGKDTVAIRQFQIVQHSTERLEARVVTDRPFDDASEAAIATYLRSQLGNHWKIHFSYPDIIERSARGKFEDFVSYCDQASDPDEKIGNAKEGGLYP